MLITLEGVGFVNSDTFGSYRQHATYVANNTLRCVVPPSLQLTGPPSPSR